MKIYNYIYNHIKVTITVVDWDDFLGILIRTGP